MIVSMVHDRPLDDHPATDTAPGAWSTVILKLKARSDRVDVDTLRSCFVRSGVKRYNAGRLAEQVADLGIAEVVLPRVGQIKPLLRELEAIGLQARQV